MAAFQFYLQKSRMGGGGQSCCFGKKWKTKRKAITSKDSDEFQEPRRTEKVSGNRNNSEEFAVLVLLVYVA
jgi:hypothetical protein